jgi:hypothetical protein
MTVMGELTAVNPVSLAHPRHLPVPFLFGREENGSEDASTEYIQKQVVVDRRARWTASEGLISRAPDQ